jgi:putative transposase
MEKISRQRRSESAWREIVERQGQSGLTVPEFCEREGIKAASLYGWRSRLREESQSAPAPPAVPKRPKPSEVPASGFIDLGSLGTSSSRFEVRLELGGGVLLHLVRGVPRKYAFCISTAPDFASGRNGSRREGLSRTGRRCAPARWIGRP